MNENKKMTRKKTRIQGEEFMRKVLAGERDFHRTYIGPFDLSGHEGFEELQEYLRNYGLQNEPFDFERATIKGLNAKGIYLPRLRAPRLALYHSNFSGAHIPESNLSGATINSSNFNRAKLWNANLYGTHFNRVQFKGAELDDSKLKDSGLCLVNFKDASLAGADLKNSCIIGNNFSNADLRDVDFSGTIIYSVQGIAKGRKTDFKKADLTGAIGLKDYLEEGVKNLDMAVGFDGGRKNV